MLLGLILLCHLGSAYVPFEEEIPERYNRDNPNSSIPREFNEHISESFPRSIENPESNSPFAMSIPDLYEDSERLTYLNQYQTDWNDLESNQSVSQINSNILGVNQPLHSDSGMILGPLAPPRPPNEIPTLVPSDRPNGDTLPIQSIQEISQTNSTYTGRCGIFDTIKPFLVCELTGDNCSPIGPPLNSSTNPTRPLLSTDIVNQDQISVAEILNSFVEKGMHLELASHLSGFRRTDPAFMYDPSVKSMKKAKKRGYWRVILQLYSEGLVSRIPWWKKWSCSYIKSRKEKMTDSLFDAYDLNSDGKAENSEKINRNLSVAAKNNYKWTVEFWLENCSTSRRSIELIKNLISLSFQYERLEFLNLSLEKLSKLKWAATSCITRGLLTLAGRQSFSSLFIAAILIEKYYPNPAFSSIVQALIRNTPPNPQSICSLIALAKYCIDGGPYELSNLLWADESIPSYLENNVVVIKEVQMAALAKSLHEAARSNSFQKNFREIVEMQNKIRILGSSIRFETFESILMVAKSSNLDNPQILELLRIKYDWRVESWRNFINLRQIGSWSYFSKEASEFFFSSFTTEEILKSHRMALVSTLDNISSHLNIKNQFNSLNQRGQSSQTSQTSSPSDQISTNESNMPPINNADVNSSITNVLQTETISGENDPGRLSSGEVFLGYFSARPSFIRQTVNISIPQFLSYDGYMTSNIERPSNESHVHAAEAEVQVNDRTSSPPEIIGHSTVSNPRAENPNPQSVQSRLHLSYFRGIGFSFDRQIQTLEALDRWENVHTNERNLWEASLADASPHRTGIMVDYVALPQSNSSLDNQENNLNSADIQGPTNNGLQFLDYSSFLEEIPLENESEIYQKLVKNIPWNFLAIDSAISGRYHGLTPDQRHRVLKTRALYKKKVPLHFIMMNYFSKLHIWTLERIKNTIREPKGRLSKSDIDLGSRSNQQCSVCLESLLDDDEETVSIHENLWVALACDDRHLFHALCISKWLNDIRNPSCPVCKHMF